jgi:hypothetical protein
MAKKGFLGHDEKLDAFHRCPLHLLISLRNYHIKVAPKIAHLRFSVLPLRGTRAGAATLALAVAMAIALLIAGCDNISGGGFYNVDSLGGKLESLAFNTAQDPYTIALSSSVSINIGTAASSAYKAWVSINTTIEDNGKYVVLDLRRCTAPEVLTGALNGIIHGNQYIKGIWLPAALTGIGFNAFSGCSHLTSVIIPTSVTSIDENAFQGCSGLTGVTIPAGVASIGNHAFYNNPASLTNVTFAGDETSFVHNYNYANDSFPYSENLYWVYSEGGVGTYVRTGSTWTKR